MKNKIPRFDPDGECLPLAIDFITSKIREVEFPKREVEEIITLYKAVKFFKSKEFSFIVKIPLVSLLNPVRFIWYLKNIRNISVGKDYKKRKMELYKEGKTFTVAYLISAFKLYGIKENWKHYFVEYHESYHTSFYDPLREILRKEYPRIEMRQKWKTDAFIPCILIWR